MTGAAISQGKDRMGDGKGGGGGGAAEGVREGQGRGIVYGGGWITHIIAVRSIESANCVFNNDIKAGAPPPLGVNLSSTLVLSQTNRMASRPASIVARVSRMNRADHTGDSHNGQYPNST